MADPKNKWNQPSTPPPPMFFGKKERDLVKQVNDELSERIIGQPIAYYPISLEESNFNETYGEAIEKVSLPPVRIYAYVEVENEQSNETYGYEYQTKLTVNFSERRITEDQNLYVRVGDFVQYGDYFYEIVRTYNDTRYYFGQVEHKFQISAECVRAREGAFRVMPAVDRPAAVTRDTTEASAPAPRPAPYPPLAASYVTINAETKLPNERVITAGSGITLTDTGAGGTLTITSTGGAGDGIFTTINGSQAYVTSSLAIGGTTAPDHKISVSGSVSASVNISASAFYGDGSNLSGITTSPAGATTQVQFNSADSFAGSANLTFNGTTLTGSYTGSLAELTTLTASAMLIQGDAVLGDASGDSVTINAQTIALANIAAGTDNTVLVYDGSSIITDEIDSRVWGATLVDATGTPVNNQVGIWTDANTMEGSTNLTFDGTTLTGSYTGSLAELSTLSASAANLIAPTGTMAGPGSYLALDASNNVVLSAGDGATTSPGGANTQVQFNNGGAFGASANLTFDGTTLTATGLSSTGNTTLGDASGDSVTINAATINPANIAAGTDNTVVVYNGSTLVTDEIDSRVWGSTLVDATGTPANNQVGIWTDANTMEGSSNLTYNGATLTGSYSGSTAELTNITASQITVSTIVGASPLAFSASTFNMTGPLYTDSILSSSAKVSASAFYGTGSGLADLTIGKAEDASYADGLFTDFAITTPVGTAVDRFNEILKALAPGPAPNLDDIDCDDTGVSSELSFGSSQAISGYTNVGTAAGFSAVDINGTYSTSTSGNDLRRATFDGTTVINGDLNEDVSADGVNYPANSFGSADTGDLQLEVNGATLCTASMTDPDVGAGVPGSGTGTDLNGNGSGFYSLSQTGSAEFADGTELDLFQHRTGKYKVVAADQRDGWNYLRVVHTSSAFSRTTNYVEWVNDSNTDALTASLSALDTLSMAGDMRLSGVKYHRGGTAEYRTDVGNAYRNVYTSTNISYTVTNGTISSVAMPIISVGSQNEMKILQLTGSLTVDATSILDSSIGASVNVSHPIKSNLSSGGSKTISGILAYNRTNTSTTTSETFRRENYRIVSGNLASYAVQADATSGGNTWNSTSSLVSSDGLLFYNQRLYSPIDNDIPNNGNFSTISNGPGSNVNYSSISGTRTFFRYFTNTGLASQTNFELTFGGDTSTRIVDAGTSLAAAKIHVFIKLPTTSTAMETGWLDLGAATANDAAQLNDFDGCFVGTPAASGLEINNDTHEATLVTQTVEQSENIIVKIVADAAWTGYISSLSISWGSG